MLSGRSAGGICAATWRAGWGVVLHSQAGAPHARVRYVTVGHGNFLGFKNRARGRFKIRAAQAPQVPAVSYLPGWRRALSCGTYDGLPASSLDGQPLALTIGVHLDHPAIPSPQTLLDNFCAAVGLCME